MPDLFWKYTASQTVGCSPHLQRIDIGILPHDIKQDTRIEYAEPGAHGDSIHRRKAHRGINTLSSDGGSQRTPATQMADDQPQFRIASTILPLVCSARLPRHHRFLRSLVCARRLSQQKASHLTTHFEEARIKVRGIFHLSSFCCFLAASTI